MSASIASSKVVVLDRDGTIVVDRDYLSDPDGLEFMPGAAASLRRLHELGYRLVVATNQSGVGRKMFSLDRLHEIHARLTDMVLAAGARLAGIYICPHTPLDGCDCRKPATGLLMRAAAELDFEPSSAIVIGDKLTDIEFGQRAGATTILLCKDQLQSDAIVIPDFIAADLKDAVQFIYELRSSQQ